MTEAERTQVENKLHRGRNIDITFIPIPDLIRQINPINDFKALCSLVRLIKQKRPDIVHTHSSKAGVLGRLAAKLAGVPKIVHTPHGHVFYGHFHPTAARIFLWIERLLTLITDRMVALTEGEKNDYINLSVCSSHKLLKIHSGVDLKPFFKINGNTSQKKRSLGIDGEGSVIGFVGWLLPIKGPMYLLKAMADVWQSHPDTSLVFVGKGNLYQSLKDEVVKMNAKGRVTFLGWRSDIEEIMPIFDIFVLPSLNEGMGRVIVEAMAAGKPIVASRVGGIPDLVQHNENGILVPPADVPALAQSVNQLLDDPETAERLGSQGNSFCRRLSLTAMVEKIDQMYSDLITDPKTFRLANEC
jgi:glycosyltransferase involved in cell wall biosynthesis